MNTAKSWRREPWWLVAAGYWAWLIWACAGEWTNSEDYTYGWFVPPLALYFLWKRLEGREAGEVWQAPEAGRAVAWIVLVISASAILPLELVRQTPIHWRPVLWAIGSLAMASTLAAAWLTGGRGALRVFLVPSLFMLVGIPWPTFAENLVSFPLMQLVTKWAVGLVHLLGYPATAAGTTISLPNCTVGVEEACSGLRSLQTALMVGIAAGELTRLGAWGRAALLGVAFAMAVAGNQVRVLMLAMAGIKGGNAGVEQLHDTAGYVVLALLLTGVGAFAWMLARWKAIMGEAGPTRHAKTEGRALPRPVSARAGWAVVALAAILLFVAHGWFWLRESLAAAPAPALLEANAAGGLAVDREVPESILGILAPDDFSYIRQTEDGRPTRVVGYHFYWEPRRGNANQLYHRPDRCMPGAGWRLDGEVRRETLRIGGRDFTFNVFPLAAPGVRALMLWGAFLNGDPVEIAFNNDVYLGTANLWQFVRTGTRVHSYEVAACILTFHGDARPSAGEIEAFANRVFAPTDAANLRGEKL